MVSFANGDSARVIFSLVIMLIRPSGGDLTLLNKAIINLSTLTSFKI